MSLNLKLSRYSAKSGIDLTVLLGRARKAQGLTSLNKPLHAVLQMFDTERTWILHDETTAYGCCAIKYHAEYRCNLYPNLESGALYNVHELCAMYLMDEARNQGWSRKMTDTRLADIEGDVIVEIRPHPDFKQDVTPAIHPESYGILHMARANGFELVGVNPKDNSPIYCRYS